MILFLLAGVVWFLWRRSKSTAAAPRDWLTVAGMFTVRPVAAAAPFLAVAVGAVAAVAAFGQLAPLIVLAGLAVVYGLAPDAHAQAVGWWRRGWAARQLVRAIVEVRCQADARWLRCPYPMPKRTTLAGPAVVHDIALPPGMDRAALEEFTGRLAAAMNVAQVTVEPHPTKPAGWARLWVAGELVQGRRPLPIVAAPDEEELIALGDGLRGPVCWQLDDEVGLAVYGAPGAGKGRLARYLAVQWLDERYGRELVVIDLQGSAEWRPLADHPRCRVLQFDPRDPAGSLTAILEEVDRIRREGADRMDLCHAHGVDNWRSLPDEVRALHPRSAVLIDEITNGLAKPPTADKDDAALAVRALGPAIGKLYRTVRKNGWQCIHVDQLTAADDTTLPQGSTAMLGRWVALGGFGPVQREQISGTRQWPEDRAQAGLGVTARRGSTQIDVIGVPSVDRQALVDTLELAALPTTEPEPASAR
ncbi:MAG: hypothetical protein AB7Q92_34150 [Acidimicrobiia bacterium]